MKRSLSWIMKRVSSSMRGLGSHLQFGNSHTLWAERRGECLIVQGEDIGWKRESRPQNWVQEVERGSALLCVMISNHRLRKWDKGEEHWAEACHIRFGSLYGRSSVTATMMLSSSNGNVGYQFKAHFPITSQPVILFSNSKCVGCVNGGV